MPVFGVVAVLTACLTISHTTAQELHTDTMLGRQNAYKFPDVEIKVKQLCSHKGPC
jgi:hypothetical protein